jgi:hypothetical protein
MNYLLALIGFAAVLDALRKKQWINVLIFISYTCSPILLILDNTGLFYHALGLTICSTIGLIILVILNNSSESKRTLGASLLILTPYLLVCLFKMLQLQGIPVLRWTLLITILAFLFLTFERRKFDQFWFIYLFVALSSVLILTF